MNSARRICSLVESSSGTARNTRMIRPQRVASSSPMSGALKKSRSTTCKRRQQHQRGERRDRNEAERALDQRPDAVHAAVSAMLRGSGATRAVDPLPPCGGGLGRGCREEGASWIESPPPDALSASTSPTIRAFTPVFDRLWGRYCGAVGASPRLPGDPVLPLHLIQLRQIRPPGREVGQDLLRHARRGTPSGRARSSRR